MVQLKLKKASVSVKVKCPLSSVVKMSTRSHFLWTSLWVLTWKMWVVGFVRLNVRWVRLCQEIRIWLKIREVILKAAGALSALTFIIIMFTRSLFTISSKLLGASSQPKLSTNANLKATFSKNPAFENKSTRHNIAYTNMFVTLVRILREKLQKRKLRRKRKRERRSGKSYKRNFLSKQDNNNNRVRGHILFSTFKTHKLS